jgi:hypothetical protein
MPKINPYANCNSACTLITRAKKQLVLCVSYENWDTVIHREVPYYESGFLKRIHTLLNSDNNPSEWPIPLIESNPYNKLFYN